MLSAPEPTKLFYEVHERDPWVAFVYAHITPIAATPPAGLVGAPAAAVPPPRAPHSVEMTPGLDPLPAIRTVQDGAIRYLDAHPDARARVLDLLCAVATGAELAWDHVRVGAFDQLVRLDRSRALTTAGGRDPALLAARIALLQRFPEPGALEAFLIELDLVSEPARAADAVTVVDVLARHGRCVRFDEGRDLSPIPYDALLTRLGAIASPVLDDVVFDMVPGDPPTDVPYRLRAFAGGRGWEVVIYDEGLGFDRAAVLGILNTICRQLDSEFRFVATPTDFGSIEVCGGDGDALYGAVMEGVMRLARVDESDWD
ncbi:MAG: hypothetical protein Q8P18_29260 [Pseudomonadota bacterium]|nr:hypothetical protein [Pseudomonadota bacterium]